MKLKEAFVILVPDSDPSNNKTMIGSETYTGYMVLVRNIDQALEECKSLVDEEDINAVVLCPGFSNQDVAKLSDHLGDHVGVCVARGDIRSTNAILQSIAKVGW